MAITWYGNQKMMHSRETQDWAQRLIDCEVAAGNTTESTQSAVVRVCEKLRLPLSTIVGVADYRSLLSRALMLARLEAPGLSAVQVTTDGSVQDLSEICPPIDPKCGGDGGVIFLAQLLGLFLTFLGAALTLQLVQDVSPHLEVATKSGVPLPFEKILQEVVQLNSVSDRLESLADDHPFVEEALISISGNIRNTAATLEILGVIRSKSDGLQRNEPKKQSKRYLM